MLPESAWLRKVITLTEAPQEVAAWMTADRKYKLWVNGRLVSRGPADIGRDYAGGATHRWFYDFRELTPFFRQGKNVIAAEVYRALADGSGFPRNSRLPLRSRVDAAGTAKADRGLRSYLARSAGASRAGWQLPAFDDARWRRAEGGAGCLAAARPK